MLGADYVLGVDIDASSIASASRSLALNAPSAGSGGISGVVDFMRVSSCPKQAAREIADVVQA